MGFQKLFNRANKKTQQEKDFNLQLDCKKFMLGIEELMKETNIQMQAVIEITENGIIPKMKLTRLDQDANKTL